MIIQRFTANSQRQALRLVRDALGDDAVIITSRKQGDSVEIFAMREADLDQLESQTTVPATPAVPTEPATQPMAQALEQLLADMQQMRNLLQQQQGEPVTEDNRQRLYRHLRSADFSDELAQQYSDLLPAHLNHRATPYSDVQTWLKQQLAARIAHQGELSPNEWQLLQHQGVIALIGPTGVGKTTTTAKLAANYVMQHGNDSLLLVTTDSYRIGAQQQLAIYAELLDVEMHALADGEGLETLAGKMQGKRLVLVDTVGMSQRDQRLAQKIAALASESFRDKTRLVLLLNAASQPATLDEVARIYQGIGKENGLTVHDCILTKLDEANRVGAVVDTIIRYQLQVLAVSVGQRVPEDLRAPNIEQLIDDGLAGGTATAHWIVPNEAAPSADGVIPKQVFAHGKVIQAVMQTLQLRVSGFRSFTQWWLEPSLSMQPFVATSFADLEPAVIRWGAPQPLQGWQHLTPHLALSAEALVQLPPVLQGSAQPDANQTATHLFDYLPELAVLTELDQQQCGWLALMNVNHRVYSDERQLSVQQCMAQQQIPLGKQTVLYRGERRRLELYIAAAQLTPAGTTYQLIHGALQAGAGKSPPVQRRYWLVDGSCSAEQVVARVQMMLQTEEYARLTRLAWRQLSKLWAHLNGEELHSIAAVIAATVLHIEYHPSAEFASLRGDLLSLSGKRGRVQGDKLVPALIHVLNAYASLQAAGRQVEW